MQLFVLQARVWAMQLHKNLAFTQGWPGLGSSLDDAHRLDRRCMDPFVISSSSDDEDDGRESDRATLLAPPGSLQKKQRRIEDRHRVLEIPSEGHAITPPSISEAFSSGSFGASRFHEAPKKRLPDTSPLDDSPLGLYSSTVYRNFSILTQELLSEPSARAVIERVDRCSFRGSCLICSSRSRAIGNLPMNRLPIWTLTCPTYSVSLD
jgi:hypothetical protein